MIVDAVYEREISYGQVSDVFSEAREGNKEARRLGRIGCYAKVCILTKNISSGKAEDIRRAEAHVVKLENLRNKAEQDSLLSANPDTRYSSTLNYILEALKYI